MKHRSIEDRVQKKRAAWIERTGQALQMSQAEVETLLETPRKQSIRINPLKGDPGETSKALMDEGIIGELFSWAPLCYELEKSVTDIRDNPLITDGYAFIQNAASWLSVLALDPKQGEAILDVCAAPGGKTSHIAALCDNKAAIWANDNSRPRLAKMQQNFDRLNVQNVNLTLFDSRYLVKKLGDQLFDRVLLDAPCSGEGMMTLSRDKDFTTWSVAQIKRLQQLQKQLILQAWQLLKPGGRLVYSTCTMAPEEDEAIVDYLLRKVDDAHVISLGKFGSELPNIVAPVTSWQTREYDPEVLKCLRLKPSDTIEAFFVCAIEKQA